MTKRAFLTAVFVLLVMGYLAAFTHFNRKPSPPPAAPIPNGYNDLVAATKLISSIENFRDGMEAAELRNFVTTNAEALALVQTGLSRQCVIPTKNMKMPQTIVDDLGGMKRLAQLLIASGRLAELEGRTNEAVTTYINCMRLGNESSRGGWVIHRRVGIACEFIGLNPLVRPVVILTPEQQKQVAKILLDLDAEAVSLAEIWDNEKRFIQSYGHQQWNPVSWIQAMWQTHQEKKKVTAKNDLVTAKRRLVAIELGLRGYQSKLGKPPAQLSELIPEFLPHVPSDPFSKRAMIYRPQGTNWLMYSVGVDGVDDGGIPMRRLVAAKGDLFYDTR